MRRAQRPAAHRCAGGLATTLPARATRHNVDGGNIRLATGTRDGHALLTVANTGPKIPPGEVERLFQPFQRLDAARTSGANGLGLGLSIVQAIADAHHATITAHALGEGGLDIQISFPADA